MCLNFIHKGREGKGREGKGKERKGKEKKRKEKKGTRREVREGIINIVLLF